MLQFACRKQKWKLALSVNNYVITGYEMKWQWCGQQNEGNWIPQTVWWNTIPHYRFSFEVQFGGISSHHFQDHITHSTRTCHAASVIDRKCMRVYFCIGHVVLSCLIAPFLLIAFVTWVCVHSFSLQPLLYCAILQHQWSCSHCIVLDRYTYAFIYSIIQVHVWRMLSCILLLIRRPIILASVVEVDHFSYYSGS